MTQQIGQRSERGETQLETVMGADEPGVGSPGQSTTAEIKKHACVICCNVIRVQDSAHRIRYLCLL